MDAKAKAKLSCYRPMRIREVKAPDFLDVWH
jgi:hypothetical protein